jgi:hypothetical protein
MVREAAPLRDVSDDELSAMPGEWFAAELIGAVHAIPPAQRWCALRGTGAVLSSTDPVAYAEGRRVLRAALRAARSLEGRGAL